MVDIINLSCPSCGGKLRLTSDIERFACGYCGNELIVRRSGGIVSLSPVVDAIREVKQGVDKTASELAILRIDREILEILKTIDNIDVRDLNSPEYRYKNIFWFLAVTFIGLLLVVTIWGKLTIYGILIMVLLYAPVILILRKNYIEKMENFNEWDNYRNKLESDLEKKRSELTHHKMIVSQ